MSDSKGQDTAEAPEQGLTARRFRRQNSPRLSKQLNPVDKGSAYWTTRRDGEVKLRLDKDSQVNEPAVTVHDLIMSSATKYAHCLALGSKYKKGWHLLTYMEYYEACRRAAKAFLKVGLERFNGVGIMGFNSTEWVIASIGAIMAGGISVGILCSVSPKACQVIAENAEMDIFVVDNDRQLQKIYQIQGYLKHLKAIVQYKEEIQEVQPNLYSTHWLAPPQWKGFLDLADDISDEKLDKIIDSQKANQCCALAYSMSALGVPKGVMLSHDNITWTAAAAVQSLSYKCPPDGQEVLVSYLPLSYIGAQIFDIWVPMSVAGTVYFPSAEVAKMVGSSSPGAPGTGFLTELLREVQPTTFYGIPWVWDCMIDTINTSYLDSTAFRRKIHGWATHMGLRANKRRMLGHVHLPLCFGLAKRLIFDPARKVLGLSNCQQFLNMGQKLPRVMQDFFLGLNIPIFEMYGQSECMGVHTLSSLQTFRHFSCGKELPNSHTKVEKENEEGIGDIHIWGRHVFMGYLNDKESTRRKIDHRGWLRTGDQGFLDEDSFLYHTGNVNDMITLCSGQKINPSPIEERLKYCLPLVRHAVVVGQGAPFLSALLTLKINAETGEARSALTREAVAICRKIRSQATWLADVLYDRDPLVTGYIAQGIQKANEEAPSESAKIIKKLRLHLTAIARLQNTPTDYGISFRGAMTKVNRMAVSKIYQEDIQKLYEGMPSS